MDEHDKRAREVVCEVRGVLPPLRSTAQEDLEVLALIASSLRSTAAAAVAAERERQEAVCEFLYDDEHGRCGRRQPCPYHGAAMGPASLASPAQAERVSEEQGATARLGALLAEAGARLTITPELVGSNGDPAIAQRVADAHARGCRETQVRIAARLRATADGLSARGPAAHYAATVLRAEADALEVGT